jgi:hypothetical protein
VEYMFAKGTRSAPSDLPLHFGTDVDKLLDRLPLPMDSFHDACVRYCSDEDRRNKDQHKHNVPQVDMQPEKQLRPDGPRSLIIEDNATNGLVDQVIGASQIVSLGCKHSAKMYHSDADYGRHCGLHMLKIAV